MCGIVGFVNNSGTAADRAVIEAMNAAITHRGPDEDGFYVNQNVALAMRRLSIIDLASGKQPIHNADRTKWIVFNGEIYNYQELGKDLEERGHSFTQTLTPRRSSISTTNTVSIVCNIYAGCLRSRSGTSRTVHFFGTRPGRKKPILYSHQPNGDLIFGSEFWRCSNILRPPRGRSRGARQLPVVSLRPGTADSV
ncbi:MAG: hypothetical protein IPN51_00020 [Chloracidobacterium sp.]|nr:hypothetical protein [Chloracidobacterium sp.]